MLFLFGDLGYVCIVILCIYYIIKTNLIDKLDIKHILTVFEASLQSHAKLKPSGRLLLFSGFGLLCLFLQSYLVRRLHHKTLFVSFHAVVSDIPAPGMMSLCLVCL